MNRRHTALKIREQPALKHLVLRQPVHLHGELGDHSQNPFAAHAQPTHVNAVGGIGHRAGHDCAAGGHHAQGDHHVLNLAVLVTLHAGRTRGHPTAECGVHKGIGEMPQRHAFGLQLFLHVRPVHAGLNAGDQGFFIYL